MWNIDIGIEFNFNLDTNIEMRKLFDSISKSIPINQFSLVRYQYQYANKVDNEIKIEIETDIFDLKSRMNSKPMFLARPWSEPLMVDGRRCSMTHVKFPRQTM